MSDALAAGVQARVTAADAEFLRALRRDLHAHPELSWQESATQARLEAALRASGVTQIERIARTGLVARIPGTGKAPPVAVRGDIDALPITEATGLPFTSTTSGVMHACGHDIHASWAVGVARLLARTSAAGEVRVILQPAEEVGEGALAVLESGALDGVAAIFGGHVDRRFAVGQVVADAGAIAASTDTFEITLHGAGAHGARPQESADPVVGLGALIGALQTIVARRLDPALPGVVTVGAVRAGDAANVIPESAMLRGTIRATAPQARALIVAELQRLADTIAAAYRLRAEVRLSEGTPPLVNPARGAAWARSAAIAVCGESNVVPLGTTNMGGEDFAFYLERLDGCFLRIGAREAGGEPIAAHSPRYAPAEDALLVGTAVLAECARVASAALA
ncbi:MAG: amidohydrolase [Gemmatimonadaceae bacterium]|nr:amidohydrolase [Gemmatimonadaceae bacterium]